VSHSVNLKPRSRRGLFFVGPLTINAGQYPIISSACRPAIVYSRVGTGRTLSAVPSSSNFPASHLGGSKLGLIAPSYRAFSSLPLGRPTLWMRFLDNHAAGPVKPQKAVLRSGR
jgi:hypothetical protein